MDPTSPNEPVQIGLRRVTIPRYENGFGFTLRHFIVYPPDVYDKETAKRLGQITEPVDTIFVKSVREDGPAYHYGLCVGDRIVSVNGERIVGKSYDQVVGLIQKSPYQYLYLEVSPKQYDTLQLFYEDKAYRPETNQRPSRREGSIRSFDIGSTYATIPYRGGHHHHNQNETYEPIYMNNHHYQGPGLGIMSSAYPNQQHPQLFSHLPRPTPYKSTSTWSYLSSPQQEPQQQQAQAANQTRPYHQYQTYYPFQSPELSKSPGNGTTNTATPGRPLWGIREEMQGGTKSAESVRGCSSAGSSATINSTNSNRYGSMECLSNNPPPVTTWKNTPGYRFSISTGPGDSPAGSLEALKRESANTLTLQGTPGGFVLPPSVAQHGQDMIVTMTGGINEMPESTFDKKMAEKIRRNIEQKEEFLRRPNQPLQWIPFQGQNSSTTSTTAFPKEFYVQPQKFQKVPWPPENLQPKVISPPTPSQVVVSDDITVTMRSQSNNNHKSQMEKLRNYSTSLDETSLRKSENLSNQLKQQQQGKSLQPKSSVALCTGTTGSKQQLDSESGGSSNHISAEDFTGLGKNRITLVGTGKLHCDPPPGWTHPTICIEETEPARFKMRHAKNTRPTYLTLPSCLESSYISTPPSNTMKTSSSSRLDSDVIFRRKENDQDFENDRIVRRVSYLKATSSPIDMDKKPSSPTSPSKEKSKSGQTVTIGKRRSVARLSAEFLPKGRIIRLKQFFEDRIYTDSPSGEFRHFGSSAVDSAPDSSEILREGQVHFKVRVGDSKKGGFHRSWRQGWAQLRRSGCLYLGKDRLTKDTISGNETDVIVCIGLKDTGVIVESADDYSKRKNVIRIKTNTSLSTVTNTSNETEKHHQQQIPVEILVQAEDALDCIKWIQTLQQQQDNNNYYSNTNSSLGLRINPSEMNSPRSILRNFLPPSSASQHQQSSSSTSNSNTNNYLSASQSTGGQSSVTPNHGSSSPKAKPATWKGKVAKQWKKMHSSSNSSTNSPLHSQNSIPESGGTFGVLLEDVPQSETSLVPKILEYCVELIERRGLSTVGIYRIPGNNAAVSALTESLNKGGEPDPEQDTRWNDVHVISSLLKSFLRKLPDPLLTSARYPDFIRAAADPDPNVALDKLRHLINDLPDTNYETLRLLTFHLKKIADNSEKNRMEPRNLAIVFGPTLVRAADENVIALVNDMQHQCKIVELLINNAEEIFGEKESETPSPVETKYSKTLPSRLSSTSPPKIELDLRASLIQAAQRKVLKQTVQSDAPAHNKYGLPPPPPSTSTERSVDEYGLIKSYAGLGEETEQRVKQFEIETRAMMYRDSRSPGLPPVPVQTKSITPDPSSISEKLTSNELGVTTSTWPIRLGPAPFKPSRPPLPNVTSLIKVPIPIPPPINKTLRKVSSIEKLNSSSDNEFITGSHSESSKFSSNKFRNYEELSNLQYDSKGFGSLDSLRDIVNGSKEDLSPKSDGSDLVSTLSRALDKKLKKLRPKSVGSPLNYTNGDGRRKNSKKDKVSKHSNLNGGSIVDTKKISYGDDNGTNSNSQTQYGKPARQDRKYERGNSWSAGTQEDANLTTTTNGHNESLSDDLPPIINSRTHHNTHKATEIKRRHSLSGTADILRAAFEEQQNQLPNNLRKSQKDIYLSSDALATALTANNILESHV